MSLSRTKAFFLPEHQTTRAKKAISLQHHLRFPSVRRQFAQDSNAILKKKFFFFFFFFLFPRVHEVGPLINMARTTIVPRTDICRETLCSSCLTCRFAPSIY